MPLRIFHRLSRRAVAAALFVGVATGCLGTDDPGIPSTPANETYAASLGVNISQMTRINDALYFQDITVGTGAVAVVGSKLQMTYTGWFVNGTQFDSNVGAATLPLTLGEGDVIPGWDQGLVGMKVGGKRRLVVGSALAYGSAGRGTIPPNTTLVFVVTLVSSQ